MRTDVFIKDVLARCDALKSSALWPSEPKLRPRAWLNNFDEGDRWLAAELLDHFTFYNDALTDRLFLAAFFSLADGLPKGPQTPPRAQILKALEQAVFAPIEGEDPNRTDSGNLMCRKARQLLHVPEDRIVEPAVALQHARSGGAVVFLDDFVGSGDQFLNTWSRAYGSGAPDTFRAAHAVRPFPALYICLVSTSDGLKRLATRAPSVAVSVAHVLDSSSSVFQATASPTSNIIDLPSQLDSLLRKYDSRLTPQEAYIASEPRFRLYGYKELGLLFAFAHSVPDGTLPIFWSTGKSPWTPLVERT